MSFSKDEQHKEIDRQFKKKLEHLYGEEAHGEGRPMQSPERRLEDVAARIRGEGGLDWDDAAQPASSLPPPSMGEYPANTGPVTLHGKIDQSIATSIQHLGDDVAAFIIQEADLILQKAEERLKAAQIAHERMYRFAGRVRKTVGS